MTNILLIGAGYMAREYAKVLKALKKPFVAVGKTEKNVENFYKEIGFRPETGGLKKWLKNNSAPQKAIVAANEDMLGVLTRGLIYAGCREILVEKPGGLDMTDIKKVAKIAKSKKSKVYVGYNRRFYTSVIKAREIIKKEDVKSFNFDFTERSYIVETAPQSDRIKREWFLQNSTHVIDMAFSMGGWPKKINPYKIGRLKWHPSGSIYAGAGATGNGALFAYHANWESAGRWSVEIITSKRKLIFRPLEKLRFQKYGSMAIEEYLLDDKLDIEFKPGLYKQVESFLGNKKFLPTIEEQVNHLKYYEQIKRGN